MENSKKVVLAVVSLGLIALMGVIFFKDDFSGLTAKSLDSNVDMVNKRISVPPTMAALSGSVYVSDTDNKRVQKFDLVGNYVTQWGGSGGTEGKFGAYGPFDVEVDANDNFVYVVDDAKNRVQKFDSSGNFILMFGWGVDTGAPQFEICYSGCQGGIPGYGNGQFSESYYLALDSNNNIYVGDHMSPGPGGAGFGRIQKFDSNGNFLMKWNAGSTNSNRTINDLDSDSQNNIYVLIEEQNDDLMYKYDSSGNLLQQWSVRIGNANIYPGAINISPSGDVFVGIQLLQEIRHFDNNGNLINQFGGTGTTPGLFSGVSGFDFDIQGNIYTLDINMSSNYTNGVQVFDGLGNFMYKWGSYGSGIGSFNWPTGIAVYSKLINPPTGCQVTVLANTMPTVSLNLGQQVIGRFSATGCPSNVVMERVQVRTSQSTGNLRITKPTIIDTSTGLVSPASNIVSNSSGAVTGISFKPSFPLTTNPNIGVVYEVWADIVGAPNPGDILQTEVINIVATDLSTAQPATITPGLPLPPQVLTF